jgi:hypothetical protein
MPGAYDRYNMKRVVSLTANVAGEDLGRVAGHVARALQRAGPPPKGATVEVRGQIAPMNEMLRGLSVGLGMAIVVIVLLLTANFQSLRLALVVISTAPAVLAGVVLALALTGTTINIESFMGAIMAIGVAVANAILLVTFAERHRREAQAPATEAAVEGARGRLRAILMTSCAMTAGMVPLALGWGEGGQQTAPLGRAVIGGLVAATLATWSSSPPSSRSSRAAPGADPRRSTPSTPRAPTSTRRPPRRPPMATGIVVMRRVSSVSSIPPSPVLSVRIRRMRNPPACGATEGRRARPRPIHRGPRSRERKGREDRSIRILASSWEIEPCG